MRVGIFGRFLDYEVSEVANVSIQSNRTIRLQCQVASRGDVFQPDHIIPPYHRAFLRVLFLYLENGVRVTRLPTFFDGQRPDEHGDATFDGPFGEKIIEDAINGLLVVLVSKFIVIAPNVHESLFFYVVEP